MNYSVYLSEHIKTLSTSIDIAHDIDVISSLISKVVLSEGVVFSCGNGGSFSDAQHFSAELVGRFRRHRRSLSAVTLGTNSSSLSAISNDFGFDKVFSRELSALATPNDILICLSTSGNSSNIISALEEARNLKMQTILLTGSTGGQAEKLADYTLSINSEVTSLIQETHIVILHYICMYVDDMSNVDS